WPFVHHLHSPFKSTTHTAAPLSKAQKELDDERHIWYAQHGKLMWWSSMICTLSALFIGVSFFSKNWQQIRSVPALHWCLSLSIILLSILYYYKLFGGLKKNL